MRGKSHMQQATRRQTGGILVFVLVGFALAALLAGGIYYSKQQGRVASQTDTVATNDTKTDDTATETPQNDTAKDDDTNEGTGTSEPTPAPTPPTPAPAPAPTPAPTPPAPATGGTGGGVPTTGPSDIAETGPSDVIVPMLALSLLVGGVISYRRSQATFRAAALK